MKKYGIQRELQTLEEIVRNNDAGAFRNYCETVLGKRTLIDRVFSADSRVFRRLFFLSATAVMVISLLTTFWFYRALVAERLRPPAVIYHNEDGTPVVFRNTEPERCIGDPRITAFIRRFIDLYSGTSPAKEKDMVSALNMMTPVFRRVNTESAERKKKQALKMQQNADLFGRQIYTDTEITALKTEVLPSDDRMKRHEEQPCDVGIDDSVALMGTAELTWRSIHDPAGIVKTTYMLFNAVIIRTGVTEYTPAGLLVNDFGSMSVESRKELDLLLQRSDVDL